MSKRARGRAAAAATFVLAALAFSSVGFAYFTAPGSGQGTARIPNTENLTVSAVSPDGSALYPGASADVAATVHNPNPIPVHVHAFVLDHSAPHTTGITSDMPGCSAGSTGSVTFNGPFRNGSEDFVFPPGDSPLTLHDALSMSTSAEDACQGATFDVYLQAGA